MRLLEDFAAGGVVTASVCLDNKKGVREEAERGNVCLSIAPQKGEGIFSYIQRVEADGDPSAQALLYRQIVGAANAFKEGDATVGVAAADEQSRTYARTLLENTTVNDLCEHSLYTDDVYRLIQGTTTSLAHVQNMTLRQLKTFILTKPSSDIHEILPGLTSDIIACLVKIMSNEELIAIGQTVFTPLPGSSIGAPGYMGARIQPNSPTDNTEDIVWQVFDGFSYAVGDVVLGTNPVSSEPDSVAKVSAALADVITSFGLDGTLPYCVLAHIDVQAQAQKEQAPENTDATSATGIWFQSIAGTVNANQTFDVTIAKMKEHMASRHGKYGLYGETGQGADFTNGHAQGVDMVVHESRKYGFLRALKQDLDPKQWVHVNDVAGFIGPEVFKSKEQLVRCCLEDTVMGKLHGLTIGLDVCSTLHMDVSLSDLDWCIDHVMPANPGYLMALPTKNDPMLSYLTTSFSDHVRIREKFGYKVNDAMWSFFQRLGVIDKDGNPTEHFGQPLWVYYQYCLAKGDKRSMEEIYGEGRACIERIAERGVPIAQGYGENYWDPPPALDKQVRNLYEDAKVSIWTELDATVVESIVPDSIPLRTLSKNRKDYVYHPESGEKLHPTSIQALKHLRKTWLDSVPDVQVVISDGLNSRSVTDDGHLDPFLAALYKHLKEMDLSVSSRNIVVTNGRVRAGYQIGEYLFGESSENKTPCGIAHIIGERPGTGHHNFSVYLTAQPCAVWASGKVDHDVTRVVSGISDTAFHPTDAAKEVAMIYGKLLPRGCPAKI